MATVGLSMRLPRAKALFLFALLSSDLRQVLQVIAVALGAWLVANDASPLQRLWVAPPLVFSLGFIDSSIQGLCTESWVCWLYLAMANFKLTH